MMTADSSRLGTKGRLLHRVFNLIPILLAGPIARKDLAVQLEASLAVDGVSQVPTAHEDPTSTLNRDLKLLRELELVELGSGRPYDARPLQLPAWLTPREARALDLAISILGHLDVPEAHALAEVLERVPARIRRGASPSSPRLPPPPGEVDPDVWSAIQLALTTGRQVQLSYMSAGKDVARPTVLDKSALFWLTGGMYLVGFRPDLAMTEPGPPSYRHVREYRLDRIRRADVLEMPVTLSDLPMLRSVFIVDGALADRLATLRDPEGHTVQRVSTLPDGSIRVEALDTGLLRARQRILAFGPHLRAVESPGELVSALTDCMNHMNEALQQKD